MHVKTISVKFSVHPWTIFSWSMATCVHPKKRKRRRMSKKQEDRELIRFLEYEEEELPYQLRKYVNEETNYHEFEILSVDHYYLNTDKPSNSLNIPLPAKPTKKPPAKNSKLPYRKSWK